MDILSLKCLKHKRNSQNLKHSHVATKMCEKQFGPDSLGNLTTPHIIRTLSWIANVV